jgi:hypothetical protein
LATSSKSGRKARLCWHLKPLDTARTAAQSSPRGPPAIFIWYGKWQSNEAGVYTCAALLWACQRLAPRGVEQHGRTCCARAGVFFAVLGPKLAGCLGSCQAAWPGDEQCRKACQPGAQLPRRATHRAAGSTAVHWALVITAVRWLITISYDTSIRSLAPWRGRAGVSES